MIIFHPLQNRAMQFSLELLSRLQYIPQMDFREIQALSERFYLDATYLEEVLSTLENAGIVILEKKNKIPVRCSRGMSTDGKYILPCMNAGTLEKEYLQYILRLPEAQLFLDDPLRRQLTGETADWLEQIQRMEPTGGKQARPVEAENFHNVLRAIKEKRMIRYQYRSKEDGQYRTAQSIPWKLEYSAYDKRWWVILYEPEQKRTIKAVLGNLRQILPGQTHRVSEQTILEAVESLCFTDQPVKLRVKNIQNALERCFLLFENQELIQTAMEEDGTFLMSFRYYGFDTDEILRKLMQLGPAVTLLEPFSLRKALREQLQQALKHTML